MKDLLEMLSYKRPAGSDAEEEFISRYIDTLPGAYPDAYGNRLIVNPDAKVIISCHTDTVHRTPGRQKVAYRKGMAYLPLKSDSNCLGADCTAGVYAAREMVLAGVPATFIFHRAEEVGGKGSDWLAANYPAWLRSHNICLALDRRGTQDIIIDQFVGDTASHSFAYSLADSLGMNHSPASGSFTDSANYAHLIPECSNLSIGYRNEHSAAEALNVPYLETIIGRLCQVDWGALEIYRNPDQMASYFYQPTKFDRWDSDETEDDDLQVWCQKYVGREQC